MYAWYSSGLARGSSGSTAVLARERGSAWSRLEFMILSVCERFSFRFEGEGSACDTGTCFALVSPRDAVVRCLLTAATYFSTSFKPL